MAVVTDIRVLGVDPGVRSGGATEVAVGEPGAVLSAHSFVETERDRKAAKQTAADVLKRNGNWGDLDYTSVVLRSERWMQSFTGYFEGIIAERGLPQIVAMESFVDQAQHAKKMMANRWQTPHLIGRLESYLATHGYSVNDGSLIYQNAGVVLPQLSSEIAALEDRGRSKISTHVLLPGDELITNDHLRKALAHALAAAFRIQHRTLPPPTR